MLRNYSTVKYVIGSACVWERNREVRHGYSENSGATEVIEKIMVCCVYVICMVLLLLLLLYVCAAGRGIIVVVVVGAGFRSTGVVL